MTEKQSARCIYALFALATMMLGLASREIPNLPVFVRAYAGDALWALMIFFLVGVLLPQLSAARRAVLALGFAFCIEFSQLYQADWINALRRTRLGGLILGFGFLWTDLVSYVVGICFGMLGERLVYRR